MLASFNQFTLKALGLAGLVGIGLGIAAPAAFAQSYNEDGLDHPVWMYTNTECPPAYIPSLRETTPFFGEKEEIEPIRGYNLACWGMTRRPGSHICKNNPNPACGNPAHFGYTYGTEYPQDIEGIVDRYWQEIGQAPPRDTTLPPVAPPPPPVAPVPGLW
ncbi:hypothetical protein K4A83_10320 [Spirulina subsalsa FACHB-351]|uniref:Secreted protein n=1 Tax=Spirulina subsalsa FACHB-351 TaxID=234711 RepID=A0ABT3L6D0_9CYAN|nr:hypothetical protein [Spirulina subsalsa]MCW6036654.1 hypothetical protein [Spirulina subsalsa FACHB-351]